MYYIYIYISYVTATNVLVSLVLIPQTEMARYYQGGEVSVFNQTQSHHQLQRMLPEGAHSLGKPALFVCLHWWKPSVLWGYIPLRSRLITTEM